MEPLVWVRGPYGPPLERPARGCAFIAILLPVALAPLALAYVLDLPYQAGFVVSVVFLLAGGVIITRLQRRRDVRRVEVTPAEVRLVSPVRTVTVAIGDVRRIDVRHEPPGGRTTLVLTYARDGAVTTAEVPGSRREPGVAAHLAALLGGAVEIGETPGPATPP